MSENKLLSNINWQKAGPAIVMAALLLLVSIWTYWPTLENLIDTWNTDAAYSHGFIIPLLAFGLLIQRFMSLKPGTPWFGKPDLLGLVLLALAALMRIVHAFFYMNLLDNLSILLILPGIALLIGGREFLKWSWPAFLFLMFMIPLPSKIGGSSLVAALQNFSCVASTFSLQTLGMFAYREGNVILLKDVELGVVEACSGLRMLMVFCAMATATAIMLPIGWQRRLLLILSAVPLAMACNVARITVAGLASDKLGTEWGHYVFHDLAGYIMMPLAFALLGIEVVILSYLFEVESPDSSVQDLTMGESSTSGSRPAVATQP